MRHPNDFLNRPQRIVVGGSVEDRHQQRRAALAEKSLRGQKREAERRAALKEPAKRPAIVPVRPKQQKGAKPDHLQTQSSLKERKERLHDSCKERPRHNKGAGGSRAYVPWCSRRR